MISRLFLGLIAAVAVVLSLVACSRDAPMLTGATMGTTYSVIVPHLKPSDTTLLKSAIDAELHQVNQAMSTYQDDSAISRFNTSKSTAWFNVPAGFATVADAAIKIAAASDGAFDPTIGPLVRSWGFGKDEMKTPPSMDEIVLLMEHTGFAKLTLDTAGFQIKKTHGEIQIDLNAIAKGYAVDQIAARVATLGYSDYLVEIGGELRISGKNADGDPWRIGIQTPDTASNVAQAGLSLNGGGIATSGDYRNAFEQDGKRYSHIIDARTGLPVEHNLASVTVVAESAMLADGWATALMVLGPEDGMKLAEKLGIACLFILREPNSGFRVTRSGAFRMLEDN